MVSHADNDILARTGPGTAMGQVMRRYWMPALLTAELPDTDCPPVRVRLLGESLVAFRDTSGQIGLLEDACPHRQASLFLGRNEENGLRCVFHGWKFDRHGRYLDMITSLPTAITRIGLMPLPILSSDLVESSGRISDPGNRRHLLPILNGPSCRRHIAGFLRTGRSVIGCKG